MSMRLGLGLGFLCRGQAAAWTPTPLFGSGEAGGWYDPSDLSTVWQDSARTTPGVVDSPVGALDDKSGNGHHLLQATAGMRPILRSDGTLYWLEKDGVDDFLASASGLTIQAGWTLGAAGSYTAGADTTTAAMFGLERGGAAFFHVGLRQSVARARSALRGEVGAVPTVPLTTADSATDAYPADTPGVLVSRFQALSHDIRLDGATLDTVATTWDGQTEPGSWLVFGRQEVAPVVPMKLYAAVALARVPDASELASLESWLAGKAGVVL